MGQRRDRVERQVAPQLHPDLVTQLGAHRRLEPSRLQDLRQRHGALRLRTVGFAQREAVAFDVMDRARTADFRRGIDHAAQHAVRAEAIPLHIAGIDALQACALEWPADLVEVPPRHAVDARHDGRVLPDQRLHGADDRRHRMRLQRHDHIILRAQLRWIGAGADRHRHRLLALLDQRQPLALHGRQMGSTRHHAHLGRPGGSQLRRHVATDGASTEDADLHLWVLSRAGQGPASRRGRSAATCPSRPWGSRRG